MQSTVLDYLDVRGRTWYTPGMDGAWHVLRVATGFEKEAYYPVRPFRQFIRRQRKWVTKLDLALPGYVFVNTYEPRRAFDGSRPFLYGFMRNGDRSYAIVNNKEMRRLQEAEREEMEIVAAQQAQQGAHRRGSLVRVLDGPFEGALASVAAVVGQKLKLEIDGLRFPATVDCDAVEVIAA